MSIDAAREAHKSLAPRANEVTIPKVQQKSGREMSVYYMCVCVQRGIRVDRDEQSQE